MQGNLKCIYEGLNGGGGGGGVAGFTKNQVCHVSTFIYIFLRLISKK